MGQVKNRMANAKNGEEFLKMLSFTININIHFLNKYLGAELSQNYTNFFFFFFFYNSIYRMYQKTDFKLTGLELYIYSHILKNNIFRNNSTEKFLNVKIGFE